MSKRKSILSSSMLAMQSIYSKVANYVSHTIYISNSCIEQKPVFVFGYYCTVIITGFLKLPISRAIFLIPLSVREMGHYCIAPFSTLNK